MADPFDPAAFAAFKAQSTPAAGAGDFDPEAFAAFKAPPSAASDVARTALPSLLRGAVSGASYLGQAAQLEMDPFAEQNVPGPEEATKITEQNVTGPLYKPKTAPGRIMEHVGGAFGSLPVMGALMPGATALSGLGAGIGREIGGTPGAIIGGLAAPLTPFAAGAALRAQSAAWPTLAAAGETLPQATKLTVPRTNPNTGGALSPDLLPPSVSHEPLPTTAPAGAATVSPLQDISPDAIRMVHRSLTEEGFTPDTLDATLESMSPHQFALEVGNTPTRYARGIAQFPGQGASDIRSAFVMRGAEAPDRMRGLFDQAFGGVEDLAQLRRSLAIDQSRAASPLYAAFRSLEVTPTPELDALIPRLESVGAFGQARALARAEGIPWQGVFEGGEAGEAVRFPTAQTWDLVKRSIDTLIDGSFRPDGAPSNWTRVYTRLKNELVDAIDNHPDARIGDIWKQARAAYAGPEAIKKAMDLGQRVLTGNIGADELPFMTAAYSDTEMAALRQGMRSALENTLGNPGRQELRTMNQILAPNNVRKLQWVLGDEQADELVAGIRHEFNMHHSPRNIIQNSITSPAQMDRALWEAPPSRLGQMVPFLRHPGREAVARGIEYGVQRAQGAAEAKAAAIRNDAARIYTMQGPERDATLRWILEHGKDFNP